VLGPGRFEADQRAFENRLMAQLSDVDHRSSQPTTATAGKRPRGRRHTVLSW
jgi:hypothetical protein